MQPATIVRLVDCIGLRLNAERMIWGTPSGLHLARWSRWLCGLLLAAMPAACLALTALPFAPVRQPLTNEIAELSALTNPAPAQIARLRTLNKANNVLSKSSFNDGKALRTLKNKLHKLPDYAAPLDTVASNLVAVLANYYNFVGALLVELPPSTGTTNVQKQYDALAPAVAKLMTTVNAAKTATLHDPLKHKVDKILAKANGLLLFEFPLDLTTNQIDAVVDGTYFKTSATAATENLFSAVATETNIAITVSAIDYPRGIFFSIPNVQIGTFRYPVPDLVTFTNRTGVYVPGGEHASGATNGNFFITANTNEVYGIFDCTGPDFAIVKGRFRISVSTQP